MNADDRKLQERVDEACNDWSSRHAQHPTAAWMIPHAARFIWSRVGVPVVVSMMAIGHKRNTLVAYPLVPPGEDEITEEAPSGS